MGLIDDVRSEVEWQKAREGHPDLDECYCGDYRYQHLHGKGACTLNGLGHHGAPLCHEFRLHRAALSKEKADG